MLRQQMKPDCRVTGVIQGKDDGWVPNGLQTSSRTTPTGADSLFLVIPDYAKMSWVIRAPTSADLLPLRERVVKCLQ